VNETWVFGYGSLVDPSSFSATIGRELRPGIDFFEAELLGFGRRWNYGVMHSSASAAGPDGVMVEYTIIRVEPDELEPLDWRERHYDRLDVTDRTTVHDAEVSGQIFVYVPRPETIERYERARDAGRAAIEQRYWDLVDDAFAALGPEAHARYHSTTPAPDVPVMALSRA
jgi:cation transport regulator ChaC